MITGNRYDVKLNGEVKTIEIISEYRDEITYKVMGSRELVTEKWYTLADKKIRVTPEPQACKGCGGYHLPKTGCA